MRLRQRLGCRNTQGRVQRIAQGAIAVHLDDHGQLVVAQVQVLSVGDHVGAELVQQQHLLGEVVGACQSGQPPGDAVDLPSPDRTDLTQVPLVGLEPPLGIQREADMGPIAFLYFCRHFYLDEIDDQWIEHLKAMDHLREGIGLRAYGQRNPLVEYKRESYALFEDMWERIEDHVVKFLYHAEPVEKMEHRRQGVATTMSHPEAQALKASHAQQEQAANTPVGQPAAPATIRRQQPKVGRNDPCPCGSGKKYKHCHGRIA